MGVMGAGSLAIEIAVVHSHPGDHNLAIECLTIVEIAIVDGGRPPGLAIEIAVVQSQSAKVGGGLIGRSTNDGAGSRAGSRAHHDEPVTPIAPIAGAVIHAPFGD